jgi:glyoxylase I family protein
MKTVQILFYFLLSSLLIACGGEDAAMTETPTMSTAEESMPAETDMAMGSYRMLQPRSLIHVVSDIQTSLDLYRDIGLEIVSGPEPLAYSALLEQVQTNAPGTLGTVVTFNIPGSEMDFQLIEFAGADGQPFEQQLYDPGVTRFSISVRDIDLAFEIANRYDIIVDTTGGEPVYTQRPRNDTRAVMMRDMDGFVFEFVQSGNPVETDVPESSNIYNARSSLALEERGRSMQFYGDILGYEASEPNQINEAVLLLEGTPDAAATSGRTQPPGSTNVWFFWEFSGLERTKHAPNPEDPGASAISILVEGLPAMLNAVKAGGFEVVTSSGEIIEYSDHRTVLVRSPDGLMVELVEMTM